MIEKGCINDEEGGVNAPVKAQYPSFKGPFQTPVLSDRPSQRKDESLESAAFGPERECVPEGEIWAETETGHPLSSYTEYPVNYSKDPAGEGAIQYDRAGDFKNLTSDSEYLPFHSGFNGR